MRVFLLIVVYLYGAHHTVAVFGVGVVVQFYVSLQHLCQLLVGFVVQLLAQLVVFGHKGKRVLLKHRFYVQSCPAAKYRHLATILDIVVSLPEIAVELACAVFVARLPYVYEVVWYVHVAVYGVLFQVLACAYVHAPIHLP